MEDPSGITFIYSNVSFDESDLPFEISDSMLIRAAKDSEIEIFKEHLDESYGRYSRMLVSFDHEPKEVFDDDGSLNRTEYVPGETKRYWVVAFNGYNGQVLELGKLTCLMTPKILLGDTVFFTEKNQKGARSGSISVRNSRLSYLLEEARRSYADVNSDELHKLKDLYIKLESNKDDYKSALYGLELFISSTHLDRRSFLLTLSLFSIIESLIAHKPRLTETLDSITHQIKNKINLLSKKYDHEMDYTSYFGNIASMKLWGKLYGLRSDIAHGQNYKFSGGNECLKNLENVNEFLEIAVVETIKLAFEDPGLIEDLRAC